MLQSIESYEEVTVTWLDINGKNPHIKVDWFDFEIAILIMDFLKLFYDATNHFSSSYYITSYLFLHSIFKIIAQFAKCRLHVILNTFITGLEGKFLEYWKTLPMLPIMALAMNPRYKLKNTIFCIKKYYKIVL